MRKSPLKMNVFLLLLLSPLFIRMIFLKTTGPGQVTSWLSYCRSISQLQPSALFAYISSWAKQTPIFEWAPFPCGPGQFAHNSQKPQSLRKRLFGGKPPLPNAEKTSTTEQTAWPALGNRPQLMACELTGSQKYHQGDGVINSLSHEATAQRSCLEKKKCHYCPWESVMTQIMACQRSRCLAQGVYCSTRGSQSRWGKKCASGEPVGGGSLGSTVQLQTAVFPILKLWKPFSSSWNATRMGRGCNEKGMARHV